MEAEFLGRILFGLCLFFSWWVSMTHIVHTDAMLYTRSVRGRIFADKRRLAFIPMTLLYIVCVTAFVWQWMELLSGGLVIAGILWIRRKEIRLWDNNLVVELGKYAPSGSCLCAYLAGYALAPLFDLDPSALGTEVACGALGGAWFLTGWKKIQLSGLNWMSTQTIGLLLAERAYIGAAPLRKLRRGVIRYPVILLLIGILGIVLELAGLAFCFPSMRMGYAITIDLFMIGIALLLGYTEPEWIVLMVALALL